MSTLVVSTARDPASLNLYNALQRRCAFEPVLQGDGVSIHRCGDVWSYHAEEKHMHELDHVDQTFSDAATQPLPRDVLFLSRHASKSGTPALCCHAIGVPEGTEAKSGGESGKYPPPSPLLAPTYRLLHKVVKASALSHFDASLEASHHGPLLKTPCMFVEIGSTEAEWDLSEPADLWVDALVELLGLSERGGKPGSPSEMCWASLSPDARAAATVVFGAGGGHYQAKLSDALRADESAFVGHMLAGYIFDFEKDDWQKTLEAARSSTALAYGREPLLRVDKKGFQADKRARIVAFAEERGWKYLVK
ncbi:hypothetical protein M885DRAFT_560779 [Pelagophyceae sp. CCMP2097]|nr:hypothetical protein M885DRAFT_560779 [Pelagophyceae sp. CCMP2097]